MNLKKLLLIFSLCLSTLLFAQNKSLELQSPDGAIKVSLRLSDKIYYTISYNQDELLKNNSLMLQLRNDALGQNPKLISSKKGREMK
ncbi:MAG: glycoside hydrolase family 97 N-terminal domain-containing protein [Segetibacter sp.]